MHTFLHVLGRLQFLFATSGFWLFKRGLSRLFPRVCSWGPSPPKFMRTFNSKGGRIRSRCSSACSLAAWLVKEMLCCYFFSLRQNHTVREGRWPLDLHTMTRDPPLKLTDSSNTASGWRECTHTNPHACAHARTHTQIHTRCMPFHSYLKIHFELIHHVFASLLRQSCSWVDLCKMIC